ncbi:nitrous oxide-stimulated promoter family protein [Leminorella grimontii]|uniref:nitrous oxide-stimulated promoter family protein n=1 Tax=Leminorella grimontii TaxID=82981 RepID=UPI00207D95C8|nr:nitrous oxide-stimulated promoter family protein [Leminorella grimontii]GKX57811.1 hypothetical protein SOASR031_01260 [Leminorella grimontii]
MDKRLKREAKTIEKMIELYARAHPPEGEDVDRYQRLYQYALKRLEKCRFGAQKPACKQCPIHCYQPQKREEIKVVMRWAGPRMLLHHPILAIRHLIDDRRPVPPIPEKRRASKPHEK